MTGFIYLWFDIDHKRYYLGSHWGQIDDGYVCSSKWMLSAYKIRPSNFKRKIIESNISNRKELLERETYWLSFIKPAELGKKYYNFKTVAAGGDIISNLSEEKKKQHKEKSTAATVKFWAHISLEEKEKRKKTAFGGNLFSREYLKERNARLCSKSANIIYPNGTKEFVTNVRQFCLTHKLEYGAMKKVLAGKPHYISHKKYRGSYA